MTCDQSADIDLEKWTALTGILLRILRVQLTQSDVLIQALLITPPHRDVDSPDFAGQPKI